LVFNAGEQEEKLTMEWYHLPYAGMIRIRFQGSRLLASSQPICISSPSDVLFNC